MRKWTRRAIAGVGALVLLAGVTPATVDAQGGKKPAPAPLPAKGRLIAFNDFHGALEAPAGTNGLVNGTPAGGAEYLATYLRRLEAESRARGEDVFTVSAGDLVGFSPLLSSAFRDEPTVEVMSALGLDAATAGTGEFAEGLGELWRLQLGGCHPTDGCLDGDDYPGARFPFLAANVVERRSKVPILLPFHINIVDGVPVGIVGITRRGLADAVNPAGIQGIDVQDEVQTANRYAQLARAVGVRAMVLVIHEGGAQSAVPADPSGCAGFTGAIAPIVAGLRPEYGIVVSGYTHRPYVCSLPNAGGTSVVTAAGANGTLLTAIDFALDKKTKQFTSITARNVIVENGVRLPDGSWARDAAGNFLRNPALVDPAIKAIVDKYRIALGPVANRVVGSISADITNVANPAGESALGDVLADAFLTRTVGSGAQLALMNPGGIRGSLVYANSPGGEMPGEVTYGEAFTVQPFNQQLVTVTLTGAQLKSVLEQQFVGFGGQTVQRILQVSSGFTYSYDSTAAPGSRIGNLALNGTPISPAASYRVTTTDFLANGGDGFSTLATGTNRVVAPGFDIDALVASLANGPIAPGPTNRITRVN